MTAPAIELIEPVEVSRQVLRMCRACDLDMCEACFGTPCRCACQDDIPASLPLRCDDCGYLTRSLGHEVSCDPDGRVRQLAQSAGRAA